LHTIGLETYEEKWGILILAELLNVGIADLYERVEENEDNT
jgi:hypothetical protein